MGIACYQHRCNRCRPWQPAVGVTKPISSVPLFSQFFIIVKTYFKCWISRLYLTSVAAAQLRRHLLNIECDSRNLTCTFTWSKILLTEKLTHGALVTPTPDPLWLYYKKSKIDTLLTTFEQHVLKILHNMKCDADNVLSKNMLITFKFPHFCCVRAYPDPLKVCAVPRG